MPCHAIVTNWLELTHWVKVVFCFFPLYTVDTEVNLLPLRWNLTVFQWLGLSVCVHMAFSFYIFSLWSTEKKLTLKKYWSGIFKTSQSGSSFSTQYCWVLVVATSLLTKYEHTRQPHSCKSSLGWDSIWNISKWCLCIICPNTWDHKHRRWVVEFSLLAVNKGFYGFFLA